jgi:GxxExxY protein
MTGVEGDRRNEMDGENIPRQGQSAPMAKGELLEAELTDSIIGAFYEVYNRLGYGFLESSYAKALAIELGNKGHAIDREVTVDLFYRGQRIGRHRLDLIVDDKVVLEIKASETLSSAAQRQCLSYLRVSGREVGLVLHFGPDPKIKRVVCQGTRVGPDAETVVRTSAAPDTAPFRDTDTGDSTGVVV